MEHACTRLRSLDLTVSQDIGSQEAIIEALLKFFRRSNTLEHLRLVFGELSFGELDIGHDYLGRDHAATSKLFEGLADVSNWDELRDLELELVTNEDALVRFVSLFAKNLCYLTFTRVTLTSGAWESVLLKLASVIEQLGVLETSMVRDYSPDFQVILSPRDTVKISENSWEFQYLLGQKALLKNLDTTTMYRQYRQDFQRELPHVPDVPTSLERPCHQ